ncbi:MAG: TMEM175 family protein [Anaerolineales bacterium]
MSKKSQVHHLEKDEMGMERLVFFSDAVFAIAITLLALEIRLPKDITHASNTELLQSLFSIWPKYLGYMISFLSIGNFWVIHHRQYRYIERYDTRLMFINLLVLMSVAFIPFTTAVISENGNCTATILYALSASVVGLLSTLLWVYVSYKRRLVAPDMEPAVVHRGVVRNLIAPAVFFFSIGLSYVDPDLAKFSWILIVPVVFLIK